MRTDCCLQLPQMMSGKKPPKIVVMGEVLWDVLPEGERLGGAPANFASHAARLGAQVHLVSAAGDDDRGAAAVAGLRRWGVDTSMLQTLPDYPTGFVSVAHGPSGQPLYTIAESVAWDHIRWQDGLEEAIEGADLLYFGTLAMRHEESRKTVERAVAVAGAKQVPVFLDVNLRPPYYTTEGILKAVQSCDILKVSDEELETVLQACGIKDPGSDERGIAALLEAYGLSHLILTEGAKGARVFTSGAVVAYCGDPVKVVDSVGAGDSFSARFAVGFLGGEVVESALKGACELAAWVCTKSGAVPEAD